MAGRRGREELKFEDAMTRLEDLVHGLEAGDLPLEEALAAFEEGVSLVRLCREKLAAAETKLNQIVQQGDGGWRLEALELAGEQDEHE